MGGMGVVVVGRGLRKNTQRVEVTHWVFGRSFSRGGGRRKASNVSYDTLGDRRRGSESRKPTQRFGLTRWMVVWIIVVGSGARKSLRVVVRGEWEMKPTQDVKTTHWVVVGVVYIYIVYIRVSSNKKKE